MEGQESLHASRILYLGLGAQEFSVIMSFKEQLRYGLVGFETKWLCSPSSDDLFVWVQLTSLITRKFIYEQ